MTGLVQGVGFRPYVHRLASELGLAGHVGNDTEGVFIEVEGPGPRHRRVRGPSGHRCPGPGPGRRRGGRAPSRRRATPASRIVESHARGAVRTFVSPDIATCADCLAELFDPADRRFRYPFINCTNCGPRFTITLSPALRPAATRPWRTSPCARPARRSTTTRPTGASTPSRWPVPTAGRACGSSAPARRAGWRAPTPRSAPPRPHWPAGEVVAVKGLGGYHLACDAASDAAVATAARPQAPPGQAVRGHGARPRGGRRPGPRRPGRGGPPRLGRAPDRPAAPAGAAPPSPPWWPRATPGSACSCPTPRCTTSSSHRCPGGRRARAGGAGHDERQPHRRAHLLRRRRRAAPAGRHRRRLAAPRSTHPRALRRLRARGRRRDRARAPAAALAGVRAPPRPAALRRRTDARRRRRAEEHVLPRLGPRRLHEPAHRRHGQPGDVGGLRALHPAARRPLRHRGHTAWPPTPIRATRRGAGPRKRRRARWRRCTTTTPTSRR